MLNPTNAASMLRPWMLIIALLYSTFGGAWSLKTHFWIAQQVLNDACDDGKLTINDQAYDLPPALVESLRSHPDYFRMGSLGPDVFPDPIVGQTTTHPGVVSGWQTDDWLKQLVLAAQSPAELAFSFGFIIHASADIFAHTYVNQYAGDVFVLTDSERDVELRHFVLEKYIEGLTPEPVDLGGNAIAWDAISVPASFLRDRLIFDSDVAAQYGKAGTGGHLAAMYAVREGVRGLDNVTQALISQLTEWAADYYKLQLNLQADLITGKTSLKAAEEGLVLQQKVVAVKQEAYEAAVKALGNAKRVVNEHPELILFQQKLLAEQVKIAADLLAESLKVTAAVSDAITGPLRTLQGFQRELEDGICDLVGWLPAIGDGCKELLKKKRELEDFVRAQERAALAAQRAAAIAADTRDETKRTVDRLNKALSEAQFGLANGTYEAAIKSIKLQLDAETKALEEAKDAVVKAQEYVDKINEDIKNLAPLIDDIKNAFDRFNPLTLLIRNWQEGIEKAGQEYINTSADVGLIMLLSKSGVIGPYHEWLTCHGQVFMAIPHQVAEFNCEVIAHYQAINNKYNEVIDGLPTAIQWLVAPTRQLSKEAFKHLDPLLKKAEYELTKFVTDEATADFLQLLSGRENASRDKLNEVYRKDRSKKKLLLFDDVAGDIDADLHIVSGKLSPLSFTPLKHAITLSKLAIMDPNGLNTLVSTNVGEYVSPYFGAPLYPTTGSYYSLLFDAIRSIDGNHQWQAFGLPYPRRSGAYPRVDKNQYGHNHHTDPTKGFRIWVDPFLRDRVFLRLFPEGILGKLGERAELHGDRYPFPACPANPFPTTQAHDGTILLSDRTCMDMERPHMPISYDALELKAYAETYHQCNDSMASGYGFTIAGSYLTRGTAERAAKRFMARFPDIVLEVWDPIAPNPYWTLMMASCTSIRKAQEARDIAIRRRIATDAYIWKPSLPWKNPEKKMTVPKGTTPSPPLPADP